MDPTTFAYDVCRHYVMDLPEGQIDDDAKKLILGWIRQRNIENLSSCSAQISGRPQNAGHALSRSEMKVFLQIAAFFKKNAAYADPIACERNALKTFLKSEEKCRITNKRLDHYYTRPERLAPDLRLWMDRVSTYVASVLGPFTPFLNELPTLVKVTAGATATRNRKVAQPPRKVSKRPVCTLGAEPYLNALAQFWGFDGVVARHCEYNRVTSVLKNWETNRTIACEADGNIPLQLAFDGKAKNALKSRGIDLTDQSKNRKLAWNGSVMGHVATVDVKTASDTCAFNAVAWTFPWEWFSYVRDVRAPTYRYALKNGAEVVEGEYAKFSSMGNGSTFCIETLLFAGACYAVGSKIFSVYGDDIVIETELYPDLKRLLAFMGFSLNDSKSFTSGPFRESCGGSYYQGVDITPFYIRNTDRRKAVMCHNVNGLAKIAEPFGALWVYLRSLVDSERLPFVPRNEDTMSGVCIPASRAHDLCLIRFKHHKIKGKKGVWKDWIPRFKAYKAETLPLVMRGPKALFLWYLDSSAERRQPLGSFIGPHGNFICPDTDVHMDEPLITSRYTTPQHKYVRKWVGWVVPSTVASPQDILWGDFVTRRESG